MIRRLVAVAAAGLVVGSLQPVVADTLYVYQGPPKLEFTQITDTTNPVTSLQPSKGTRTWHSIDVSVVSNGDPSTIDRVTFCLYKDSEFTDSGVGDTTADELCGYKAGTGAAPSSPDPQHVAAFTWEESGDNFTGADDASDEWSVEGSTSHELDTAAVGTATTTTTDYDDTNSNQLTLNKTTFTFVFALSHATANADDWNVRVSAQTTSLGADGSSGGSGADADVTQGAAADSFETVVTTYDVYFFAAFSSDTLRGQQDFGSVVEGGTSTITSIDTARYWANDEIDISMIGTDFTGGDPSDIISLVTDDPLGVKAVRVECYLTGDDSTKLAVPSISTWADDTNILLSNQGPSGESPLVADQHDCVLTYGQGATYGDSVYSNTMTLGLLDADITDGIVAGDYGIGSGGSGPATNP